MSATGERRSGQDRRQLDLPSNDSKERRRLVESRKGTIIEMTISDDEWEIYFGSPSCKAKHHAADEEAAAILERARG